MKPRLRLMGLVVGVSLLAVGALALRARPAPERAELQRRPALSVSAMPERVRFTLRDPRGAPFADGVSVRAALTTPSGPISAEATTANERVLTLEIPYVRAGLVVYRVTAGRYAFEGRLERQPLEPVTPLALKLGARAVRVAGDRDPALVLHPLDRLGNVSVEDVRVRALYPDSGTWSTTMRVEHLVAWSYIPARQRTGILKVSATSLEARGERAETDLLPGPVASARLVAPVSSAPSGPREAWRIELRDARDELGNPAIDGTAVRLAAQPVGGQRDPYRLFAVRPLVRATASLTLPALVPKGEYGLAARADAFAFAPVRIRATQPLSLSSLPARIVAGPHPGVAVGPVTDRDGALPDDGTPVTLEVVSLEPDTDARRVEYATTVALVRGRAEWTLPPLPEHSRFVRVTVFDSTVTLEIPRPSPEKPR